MNFLTTDKRILLNEIKYFYGLNENANELLQSYFTCEENKLWDLQEALVEHILKDSTLSTYKPYKKYERNFLRSIINIVESFNEEVNNTVFEDYITNINGQQVAGDEEKYFLVVLPKNEDFTNTSSSNKGIIIEQYASIISNGTTGLHVWPACYQLVDYLKKNTKIFMNKTILELGCGLGLLGLNCLQICEPKKYIFTDSHMKVLSQLNANIQYNSDSNNNTSIIVERLDWNDLEDCSLLSKESKDLEIDIILASDIIFDPELMPALVNTLDFLWKKSSNKDLCLYIASTIRNKDTYDTFITNLEHYKFKYETMEKNTCNLKNSSNSTPTCEIELLKIFR